MLKVYKEPALHKECIEYLSKEPMTLPMLNMDAKNIDAQRNFLFKHGFLQVKNLLNDKEIKSFESACDLVRKKPTPFKILKSDKGGDFFMDYNNWRRHKEVFDLCNSKKLTNLIKSLTNSKQCWLMHEDIIIKSGPSVSETPIHHDRPYFIFKGDLNLSLWISITDIPRESSLICFSGSHLIPEIVLPKQFVSGKTARAYKGLNQVGFTEINEEILSRYEPVDFEIKAGDAIIFFNKTLHSSKKHTNNRDRKNFIIRYLLDGATLTKKYYNNVPPYERMGVKVIEDGPVPEKYFPELLT